MIEQIWATIYGYGYAIVSFLILGAIYVIHNFFSHKIKTFSSTILSKVYFTKLKTISKESALTYTKIFNELIYLRAKTESSRAYIYQFHNGENFANLSSRWKMSETYETCADGIKYQGKNLQNLDITLFWDIVQIFYQQNNQKQVPGIKPFNTEPNAEFDFKNNVYLIDVDELDGNRGFTKSVFTTHGIKYAVLCPILNINSEPVGFVGLDYCLQENIDFNDKVYLDYFELLHQASSNLSYAWTIDPTLRQSGITINKKNIESNN